MLRRLALPVLLFLAWTPVAQAWSWPVQGPVLQPFSYKEAQPYAPGQHRGIDIGADSAGENVVAPATGTVSFAGTVPTNGKSVTIETPDGYSVTLTHLGSILLDNGTAVTEGDALGTIGPSGTPEFDEPYVHLGIRLTADPSGYLDPLRFLPPLPQSEPAQSAPIAPQPVASSGAASKPASTPATTHAAAVARNATRPSQAESRPRRSAQRPAVHAGARAPAHTTKPHRRLSEPRASVRRWVAELAVPRLRVPGAHVRRPQAPTSSALLALVCNGAAAVVALVAALAAGPRRRLVPNTGAQVLHLPRLAFERRRERHAA